VWRERFERGVGRVSTTAELSTGWMMPVAVGPKLSDLDERAVADLPGNADEVAEDSDGEDVDR